MSKSWTRLSCVREESTTGSSWEQRAIIKKWNCIADSSRTRRTSRPVHSWKLRDLRKRWRNFKACSWRWSKERSIWNRWQQVTEFSYRGFAGGEDEGYFFNPKVAGSTPVTASGHVDQW